MTVKVNGGFLRGRKIKTPLGTASRPTSDKIKEMLFGILGANIDQANFLDLFAGAGIVGIEALSRGVSFVSFVEQAPAALKFLSENIKNLNLDICTKIYPTDVLITLKKLFEEKLKFEIIFIDPPYQSDLALESLQFLSQFPLSTPAGIVAVQHFHKLEMPEKEKSGNLVKYKVRRAGETSLTFYQYRTSK